MNLITMVPATAKFFEQMRAMRRYIVDEIKVTIPLCDMCRALADRAARFQVAVMVC